MAFGRLDIFWPDGQIDSYILEDEIVSVGRGDGNVIQIDTEMVSRYHFSLDHKEDGKVYITDLESANGTHVDGIRIESNQATLLGRTEEIMVGHLRMLYQEIDDSPTMPIDLTVGDTTQRVEQAEAEFQIEIPASQINVWPASNTSTEIFITNTSNQTQRFQIRGSGLPNEWFNFSRREIEIDRSTTEHILINIKPPRHSDTKPGEYTLLLSISPLDDPTIVLEAMLKVMIKSFGGFGMALVDEQITTDKAVQLFVQNQGSEPLPIRVKGVDKSNRLQFGFPVAPIVLAAGQRLQITGEVRPQQIPLIGSAKEIPFDVVVQSDTANQFTSALDARVVVAPRIPTWLAYSAGAASLIFVALIGVLLFGLLTADPEPIVTSFTLNSSQLQQGEPLILSWSGEDVEDYSVMINGSPYVTDLDETISSTQIDTSNLYGDVQVKLAARNGDESVVREATILVYLPVSIESFTVEPTIMVRNVASTLNIGWNAPNAVETTITGLENFATAEIPTKHEASGILSGIGGIPMQTFTVTLFAEDELGNFIEESITVDLVNPQCTTQEVIRLYNGPGENYQEVATIPTETNVIVNAQDSTRTWTRIELSGASGWGLQSALLCSDTFDPNQLRIENNIPLLPTREPTQTSNPATNTPNPPTVTPITPTLTPIPATATSA